jgi:hypothetical protein
VATNPLPSATSIADLVTMLVGKKVRAVPTAPLPVPSARGLATYIDGDQKLRFVALTDMAFLAGVGAALAMIPAGVVTEAIKTGKPSSVLTENAFEVMNIVSSLYNDADGKGAHIKIKGLVILPPVPPEVAQLIAKPAGRIDLEIQLPGYANGKLTLLALP